MTKNGISCNLHNSIVMLDPKHIVCDSINFISHAHKDHLPIINNNGMILTSIETKAIAHSYGLKLNNFVESFDSFELINSGHILGSKCLFFNDILYTGDICTRNRGIISGAKLPKAKILITECTFGLPEFIFPKLDIVIKKVNELISMYYSKGIPVILLGYALGKAQTLTQLFSHWEPMYHYHTIKKINDIYRNLGIDLKNCLSDIDAENNGLLAKKPWIMIAPFMSTKNKFIDKMKSKFGAITIGFTGWAHSSRFSFGKQYDYLFTLSDHCDFSELIDMVYKTKAEKVYTVHGFTNEFATYLKKIDIDAEPLSKY